MHLINMLPLFLAVFAGGHEALTYRLENTADMCMSYSFVLCKCVILYYERSKTCLCVWAKTETSKVMREKMSITIKLGILKLRKSSQIVFLQFAFMKGGIVTLYGLDENCKSRCK